MATSKSNRIFAAWGPVVPWGMTGWGPGFTGGMNGTLERVAYTAGCSVSQRWPKVPSPRLDWTDAALALSLECASAMVSYVGSPLIFGREGKGKPSIILSTVDMVKKVSNH